MKKVSLILIISIVIIFYNNCFAQISIMQSDSLKNLKEIRISGDIPRKSPKSAMLRSAILPGWGQYYNEKKYKPYIMFGLQTGLVVTAVLENQWAYDNFDKANENPAHQNFYMNRYEYHKDRNDLFVWWSVFIYFYNIADAYVDAHLFGFDEETEGEPHFQLETKIHNNTKFFCIRY